MPEVPKSTKKAKGIKLIDNDNNQGQMDNTRLIAASEPDLWGLPTEEFERIRKYLMSNAKFKKNLISRINTDPKVHTGTKLKNPSNVVKATNAYEDWKNTNPGKRSWVGEKIADAVNLPGIPTWDGFRIGSTRYREPFLTADALARDIANNRIDIKEALENVKRQNQENLKYSQPFHFKVPLTPFAIKVPIASSTLDYRVFNNLLNKARQSGTNKQLLQPSGDPKVYGPSRRKAPRGINRTEDI